MEFCVTSNTRRSDDIIQMQTQTMATRDVLNKEHFCRHLKNDALTGIINQLAGKLWHRGQQITASHRK